MSRDEKVASRTTKNKQALLEQLRKNPIVLNAVRSIGLGRTTYYDWRKRDKKFAKAADEAIAEGIGLMNEVAELQLLSLIKEKKFDPIRFWLTHRHPAYGNKLELSGTVTTREGPMTQERKALLWRSLRFSQMYGKKQKNH